MFIPEDNETKAMLACAARWIVRRNVGTGRSRVRLVDFYRNQFVIKYIT